MTSPLASARRLLQTRIKDKWCGINSISSPLLLFYFCRINFCFLTMSSELLERKCGDVIFSLLMTVKSRPQTKRKKIENQLEINKMSRSMIACYSFNYYLFIGNGIPENFFLIIFYDSIKFYDS